MTRAEALRELLSLPDDPELPVRRHRLTQPRDLRRDPNIIKRDLARAWCERRSQDLTDISEVVNVRKLKIVRMA